MKITMAAIKDGDNCIIFADMFSKDLDTPSKSAKPAIFIDRPIFATDTGEFGPVLTILLEDAKEMAKEILAL